MEPLSPELVDELLSAELDGAFDAAAREHGYAPSIARELLDGTPGVAERRDALAAARDAIAVTPLAAADRDALVAGALRAAPVDDLAAARASRRPRLAKYIAVAAALLVVVGLGVAVANVSNGGGGDDSSSASGARPRHDERLEGCGVRRHRAGRVGIGLDVTRTAAPASARLMARTRCGNGWRPSSGARARRLRSSNRTARRPTRRHPPPASRSKRRPSASTLHSCSTDRSCTPARRARSSCSAAATIALIVVVADTGDTCRLLVSQLLHQGT